MFKFFSKKSKVGAKKPTEAVIKRLPLLDELMHRPEQFSFTKALDVVVASQNIKLHNIPNQTIKHFEIKSNVRFCSAFSDISAVEGVLDGDSEIHTNIQGMAGITGTLPDCYVEEYITHNKESKQAVTDFMDIFNNRILSLRYMFMKKHDVTCLSSPMEKSLIGNIMLSLSGFEFYEKKKKSNVRFEDSLIPKQFKISCQSLLWKNTRSSEGLRAILSSFFEVPVRIEQFAGGFVEANKSLQTKIGKFNKIFNILGLDSFLGNKTWDSMKGINIFIGPLPFDKYTYFLPKLSTLDEQVSPLQKMKEVIKTYVPTGIDVKIHFLLDRGNVKETFLNGVKGLNKDSFILGINNLENICFTESVKNENIAI